MNKSALFVGLLCVLVAVGAYFFLGNKSVSVSGVKNEQSILLYVERGDVSYRLPGYASFNKATTSPITITNGTQVYTGLGQATVLFPNNSSVALDEYTELTVTYEEDKVSLLQTLGTTYHRVEALVTGASYEVETPGTLAAVRGTKFAVKYDKKKKTTKVSVTEHKVQVATFKRVTSTSTKELLESRDLEEGKTARVEEVVSATSTSAFTVVNTQEDQEMNEWINRNKARDYKEDMLRNSGASKEYIREQLKVLIREISQTQTAPVNQESTTNTGETRVDTQTTTTTQTKSVEETKPVIREATPTQPKPQPVTETQPAPTQATKINEEVFFDRFTSMFINYFYLDEKDTPCTIQKSASERVREVTTYASQSGYPFTSNTLSTFAQSIETYCKTKTQNEKIRLQTRFDAEFPFKENI